MELWGSQYTPQYTRSDEHCALHDTSVANKKNKLERLEAESSQEVRILMHWQGDEALDEAVVLGVKRDPFESHFRG